MRERRWVVPDETGCLTRKEDSRRTAQIEYQKWRTAHPEAAKRIDEQLKPISSYVIPAFVFRPSPVYPKYEKGFRSIIRCLLTIFLCKHSIEQTIEEGEGWTRWKRYCPKCGRCFGTDAVKYTPGGWQ